jgi:hypothetical protein
LRIARHKPTSHYLSGLYERIGDLVSREIDQRAAAKGYIDSSDFCRFSTERRKEMYAPHRIMEDI